MTSSVTTTETADFQPPAVPTTPFRRKWWISVGLAIVIFLGGAVTGAGIATALIRNALHSFLHHPDKIPATVLPLLKRSLSLTDEQYSKVEQIVRDHHSRLQQVRRDALPLIQKEFDSLDRDVSEVLNEQQCQRWKRRFNHVRGMWFPIIEQSTSDE